MKLACVIHRFGADIAGGSEGHCRLIAEHLAASHDVTIVTTCARDHITWSNHYPAGDSHVWWIVGGVAALVVLGGAAALVARRRSHLPRSRAT